MSDEPMELAKNYDPKKTPFPAYAQIKYDGVPLTFKRADGKVTAYTRQNEVATSVPHLVSFAEQILEVDGSSFTGECLVQGKSFKDSSGLVRRQEPCQDIICVAFDYDLRAQPKLTYHVRRLEFEHRVHYLAKTLWLKTGATCPIFVAPSELVQSPEEGMKYYERMLARYNGNIEGVMFHHAAKAMQPGKRCWGMGRYKPQPTIDLEVHDWQEAVNEAGEGLGMIGRVNVILRRRFPEGPPATSALDWSYNLDGRHHMAVVGVGPGKLDHKERCAIWKKWNDSNGTYKPIVEIKYMPDATYEALRQPTIQRIRHDKFVSDILEYRND